MLPENTIEKATTDYSKILQRLAIVVVAGVVAHLLFVWYTTDKEAIKQVLNLSAIHLAAILLLMHFSWSMYALRIVLWSSFLKEKISFPGAFKVVITSEIASAISPTSVGGAPVKAGLLLQKKFQPGNVGFILTYGVIEDLIFYLTGILLATAFSAGILVSSVSLLLHQMGLFVEEIVWLIVGLFILIYLYKKGFLGPIRHLTRFTPASITRLWEKLQTNLLHGLEDMKKNYALAASHGKKYMLVSFFLLLSQWMAKFSIFMVLLLAFNIEIPVVEVYIKQWMVQAMMLMIPTPGASGGAEASFLLVFDRYFPEHLSFIMVSTWRLFTYYLILVSAVGTFLFIPFFTRCWQAIRA
jgi:uncharacterized protein (TIRG00374 family)